MRLALGVVLALMFWPLAAVAGPWPRERGAQFVSTTLTGDTASLWVEHGLGRDRWLVAEAWRDRAGAWGGALRWNQAMRTRGAWRMALSLGLAVDMPVASLTIVRPPFPVPGRPGRVVARVTPGLVPQAGVSLGRSLARPVPGWLALDLRVDGFADGPRLAADLTLGLRPAPRWMLMVQAHGLARPGHRPAWAVVPSAVWQLRGGLRLQAGLHGDLRHRRAKGKLAAWMEF